ncbi:MAG TPA: ABC transporter permease [Candidatus Dormibacteraeota bacterium]|nr:ABC transporter permease [Candidatus Dormibacteraeota bacterium]
MAVLTTAVSRERSPRGTTRVAVTLATVPSTMAAPAQKPSQLRAPTRLRWHLTPAGRASGGPDLSVFQYIADNWDTLGPQTTTHLEIVGLSMLAAAVVGLALGVLASRWERFAAASLAVTSTLLTVPSYALFGLLTIWFGLGSQPVVVGLALYALLPVLRNTRTGILAVDPSVVEAARGMGMSPLQILARVELPLAVPVIIAGLRQATVMVVAIATVGATVGANDLGQPILSAVGRSSGTLERLLSGMLPVAAIGILADLVLAGLQRLLSRGRVVVAAT